ncbi:glycoside hydrolase domain-containing protein [Lentisphaerota bacterium WC36G]|nr:DUF6067 family protein [Lentisphaerae bacterium WC36]
MRKRLKMLLMSSTAISLMSLQAELVTETTGTDADDYNMPEQEALKTVYNPVKKTIMDEYATENEVANFTKKFKRDLYVFGGDRLQQVKLKNKFPKLWINNDGNNLEKFIGKAQPNEYYVFYLGLYSTKDIKNIQLNFEDLKSTRNNSIITKNAFQCFNLGGTNFLGEKFTKNVNLKKDYIQPMYVGIQIPQYAQGSYKGKITVTDLNGNVVPVNIQINVDGEMLANHGDDESQRLSRLRWLNSIAEQDTNELIEPFTAIQVNKATNELAILGRNVSLTNIGIPKQIQSFFNSSNTAITSEAKNILEKPFSFKVLTNKGALNFTPKSFKFTKETAGAVCWTAISTAKEMTLIVKGRLEMDGFMQFKCQMKATENIEIEDIALDMQYTKNASRYFMGIGEEGGLRKPNLTWKWWAEGRNQDGFWMGDINAGLKVRLKGANYHSPLINAYYKFRTLNKPKSWGNGSKGGIRVNSNSNGALATAYSGSRTMKANETLQYDFDCFITPFKPINMVKHFKNKYFHPGQKVDDPRLWNFKWIKEQGANVVNIHHNKEPNPTINYPYYDESMPILKKYVKQAHENDMKVKIYYTTREITNNIPEFFAFHAMNGEIICPGPGKDAKPVTNQKGPHKWLLDNLGENFIPAWREVLKGRYKGLLDLAVITTPDSRLENYYIEGLKYTVKNTNIDGLYIDDTSLSRNGFKRVRKVLLENNPNSIIDAHSWNHRSYLAGRTNSAYYYMPNYPYFDKLWYGEGFAGRRYESVSPDYWLIEISGIPFGLMGELMGSHVPAKGMLFGMGQRLGWGRTFPQETWKLWNDFGIEKSTFFGYWDTTNPIKDCTGNKNIKLSSFVKNDGALFTVINWNKKDNADVKLAIDFDKLGLNKNDYKLVAPKLNRIQDAKEFSFDQSISLKPNQGYIIWLKKK